MKKTIIICRGRTCSKNGSSKLLDFIQKKVDQEIQIKTQYCFGMCGNGCVVFSLPEEKLHTYVDKKTLVSIANLD